MELWKSFIDFHSLFKNVGITTTYFINVYLIPEWIDNHMPSKVWNDYIYFVQPLNGNVIPFTLFCACDYLSFDEWAMAEW